MIDDRKWVTSDDIDKNYLDQAWSHTGNVFVSYTPEGIRAMDTAYAKRIMKGNEDKSKLQEEIQANPHLHQILKNNLIQNLYEYNKLHTPSSA